MNTIISQYSIGLRNKIKIHVLQNESITATWEGNGSLALTEAVSESHIFITKGRDFDKQTQHRFEKKTHQ